MNRYPNLKALRIQNNYKQEYVADVLGISQPEYSKMETGVRKVDAFFIKELCKLYDVGVEVLLRQISIPMEDVRETEAQISRQVGGLSQDVITKLMENYSFLLDSYVKQQQVQEKIIDRLIGNPPTP